MHKIMRAIMMERWMCVYDCLAKYGGIYLSLLSPTQKYFIKICVVSISNLEWYNVNTKYESSMLHDCVLWEIDLG